MTHTTRNQTSCPLSIVIPVYNEEAVLPALFEELESTCAKPLKPHGPVEIVFVNDGSTDKSWDLIRAYCLCHPGCIGVKLSRNFGHQLALSAGLETARGNMVITMDADLQDPPAVIGEMIEACRRGYDVVYATRRERGAETATKRLTAHFFYFLIEKLSGTPIPHNTGDFRLLSRRALTELSRLRETHRFLRGLVPWIGFPQTQVFYDRADRVAGNDQQHANCNDRVCSGGHYRGARSIREARFANFLGYADCAHARNV